MSDKNEFLRGKPRDASGEQLIRFFFKAVTAAIIFIGIWVSTQRFCSLVNYNEGWCGRPFYLVKLGRFQYPLYQPFNIFYWALVYYRRLEIHPPLYRAFKLCGVFSAAAIAFYFLMEFVLVRNRKQNVFGTARWASEKDIEKAGLLGLSGGMIVGQTSDAKVSAAYDMDKNSVVLHLLKKGRRYIVQAGIYNMLLAAPTRAGKGVSNVIPTLLSYPGSMIVLDFKGENFDMTSGFRATFGRVYRWEPVGYSGHHFNPMMEIRGGEDAFSDANLIADILTTPASGAHSGNASSEHFTTAARDFLTSLILHCLCSDWPDKSLPGCRSFLAQADPEDPENSKYIYDLMINADHGDPAVHQSVVEGASAQRKRPDDEGGSVLSTVNNALAVFADAKIKRNTADSEFYIGEFESTNVPITLYITIQYSDVQRISSLIRMFITLFSRRFTSGQTSAAKRKFKIPLLFILDEFDKLGRMDELEMNMGIHNGFGIHYFLIFQSINQLNKLYTKDHSFLAHCRNSIFFAPGAGEYDNAELISKICGKESISKANISYSGGRGGAGYNNASLSTQDQERNLINADEVMKLPLDRFILLVQGMPPYIGKKNVFYEDPVFKSRMKSKPAFSNREEAVEAAKSAIQKLTEGPHWFDLASEMKKFEQKEEDPEIRDVELPDGQAESFMETFKDEIEAAENTGDASGGDSHEEGEFAFTKIDNFIKAE
jgi:type IV secretion system protein VirD4